MECRSTRARELRQKITELGYIFRSSLMFILIKEHVSQLFSLLFELRGEEQVALRLIIITKCCMLHCMCRLLVLKFNPFKSNGISHCLQLD